MLLNSKVCNIFSLPLWGTPGSMVTYPRVLRTWMFSQGSEGALPVTEHQAKRENGALGEGPPVSTMTY
jgi:hypothetical protein